jgi:hypothetical protein
MLELSEQLYTLQTKTPLQFVLQLVQHINTSVLNTAANVGVVISSLLVQSLQVIQIVQ